MLPLSNEARASSRYSIPTRKVMRKRRRDQSRVRSNLLVRIRNLGWLRKLKRERRDLHL